MLHFQLKEICEVSNVYGSIVNAASSFGNLPLMSNFQTSRLLFGHLGRVGHGNTIIAANDLVKLIRQFYWSLHRLIDKENAITSFQMDDVSTGLTNVPF